MKKILIFLAAISLLFGCATFGTFQNLKKGESSQEAVRSMLGEPSAQRFEGNQEVWQYHFVKKQKESQMRTILNLDIVFKDKEVENYNITVSKESVPEEPKKGMQQGQPLPQSKSPIRSQGKAGGNFINQFDRDNDGRVSRNEFPGPEEVFSNFDRNQDGYIDADEAPQGPPRQKREDQRGGPKRQ